MTLSAKRYHNRNDKIGVWLSLTLLPSCSTNPYLSSSIPKTLSLQKNILIPQWEFKALVDWSGPVSHYKTIFQLYWWNLHSGISTSASTLLTPTLGCSPPPSGLSFLSLLYSHDFYPSLWPGHVPGHKMEAFSNSFSPQFSFPEIF